LVLIAEEASQLPFDIAHRRVILYGVDLDAAKPMLQRTISLVLSTSRLEEAACLFDLAQYRGAIAAGGVVLEQRLRDALATYPAEPVTRMSLGQMLSVAQIRKLVKSELMAKLREVVALRNRAVHEIAEPTKKDAQFVLEAVREVLDVLPERGGRGNAG